jgi:hypothetical protein
LGSSRFERTYYLLKNSLIGLPSSEESFKVEALTVSYEAENTLRHYYRSNNSCTTIAATPALIQIQSAHASRAGGEVVSSNFRGGTIAVSGSNVYAAWWNNKTGDFEVMFRASTNNGHTFGPKINLSNSPGVDSTAAQIGAEGKNVYVIWWETSTSGHAAEPLLKN